MATARLQCTCATCGKEFEVVKTLRNTRQAEEWKKWADGKFDECKECYRDRINAENAAKAKVIYQQYHIPAITEGSEKQISYANNLRDRYVVEYEDRFKTVYRILRSPIDEADQLHKSMQLHGIANEEEALHMLLDRPTLETAHALMTETDAKKIIDMLR